MKVILKESIDTLGKIGEIVNVSDGYARNFLIPMKKVMEANSGNLKMMDALKRAREAEIVRENKEFTALAEKLGAVSLSIEMTTGEEGKLFGSVTAQDIAAALGGKGFTIDKKKIVLSEAIKTVGDFTATIKLSHDITATIKVAVTEAPKAKVKPAEEKPKRASTGRKRKEKVD